MANDVELIRYLDLENPEHIDWLKKRNNPADNFTVALSQLAFDYNPPFINWLVEQPDLDRATAALIFFGVGGFERIVGKHYYGRHDDEWAEHLLGNLCARSEAIGFKNDRIAAMDWCKKQREELLAFLSEKPSMASFPVPYNIFRDEFKNEGLVSEYVEIGECDLVTRQSLSEDLPHIFGNPASDSAVADAKDAEKAVKKKRRFFSLFK